MEISVGYLKGLGEIPITQGISLNVLQATASENIS